jgi:hypothetical protein
VKKDSKADLDPIEELLLTAYPNPERKGCPDRKVLEALGNLKINQADPAWNHVWHCSPCFTEFKAIRDLRWEHEAVQSGHPKRQILAAALLVAAVLVGAALILWQSRPVALHTELALVTLDLYAIGTYRGGNENHSVNLPALPRRLDQVHVILPQFSEPGHYSVAILRSRSSESAVALGSGIALGSEKRAELTVRLDLTRAAPGKYWLGTRRDEDQSVYYYPLRIR